jgi:ParB-like chromosome segregation protein Spo0J
MADRIIEEIDWTPHPLAEFFDMLDDAALNDLAADIKKNGLRESIKVWDGHILDGRNRYAACKLAGVKPTVEGLNLRDENEAADYVISRNIKRRHLTKPQRDVLISRLKKRPEWAQASNRAIAKQIGVGETTVRRALSAPSGADAPQVIENTQPDSQRSVTVKRGEQEYRMRVERKPDPVEQTTAAVADKRRAEAAAQDANYLRKQARVALEKMSEAEQLEFFAREVKKRGMKYAHRLRVRQITVDDIVKWLKMVLPFEHRQIADAAFNTMYFTDRLGHYEMVRAWVEEHERKRAVADTEGTMH